MASGYVNSGNLGIPIATYALGDASAVVPVLLFQLAVMTPVFTTVMLEARRQRREDGRRSRSRSTVAASLTNPITLARSAVGLVRLATGVTLPEPIARTISLMGDVRRSRQCCSPSASRCAGHQRPGRARQRVDSGYRGGAEERRPAVAGIPGSGAFVLDLDGLTLLAVGDTAALPTAQNVFTYAVRYEQGVVFWARDAALVTTIISVPVLFTITVLLS